MVMRFTASSLSGETGPGHDGLPRPCAIFRGGGKNGLSGTCKWNAFLCIFDRLKYVLRANMAGLDRGKLIPKTLGGSTRLVKEWS